MSVPEPEKVPMEIDTCAVESVTPTLENNPLLKHLKLLTSSVLLKGITFVTVPNPLKMQPLHISMVTSTFGAE